MFISMKPNIRILVNTDLVYFQSKVKKFDVLVRLIIIETHSFYYIFWQNENNFIQILFPIYYILQGSGDHWLGMIHLVQFPNFNIVSCTCE